jgi:hypothetical protein
LGASVVQLGIWLSLWAAPEAGRHLTLDPGAQFRVSSGTEWDTNARRAVAGGDGLLGFGNRVVGDALLRLTVDAEASLRITDLDVVQIAYLIGAKRFFGENTEDLLTHDLRLYTNHLFGRYFSFGLFGQGKANRMRSGARDYTLGLGEGALTLHLTNELSASIRGRATSYDFTDRRLAFAGPGVGGEVAWRPHRRFRASLFADFDWRKYRGNAVVPLIDESTGEPFGNFVTLCDGTGDERLDGFTCAPVQRRDTLLSAGARLAYQGPFILGGSVLGRFHRSNSDFENFDRFQLSAFATVPLPFRFAISLLGVLQLNRGTSLTQAQIQADDDENQNRLDAQLSYGLGDGLHIDAKYSLFADEFQNQAVDFVRHTFYLGLSYEIEANSG